MKVDVQILIDALTTERSSIDRAISALRQISPTTPPVARATPVRHRRRTRTYISDETKRQIVARMSESDSLGHTAKAISREFGMSAATVRSGWIRWQQQFAQPVNGDAPVVQEVTHEVVQ